ncbi:MAG: hypothetical protein ABN479_12930, partial [Billgrantia sp.]
QQPFIPEPEPFQERSFQGKGSKGKNWRRDEPRRYPPRRAISVEPPTLGTLRTLLHHPGLAQNVPGAHSLAAEQDPYAQLLVALLEALQKKPGQSALQLIARWHGTEQGRLLRHLAEKEWLISPDNLEQQFFDTITRLAEKQRDRRVEHLLEKSRQSELSSEEKEQLRELLIRTASPTPSSPSGV